MLHYQIKVKELVDSECEEVDIDISNLNRQIITNSLNVDLSKVDEAEKRIKLIIIIYKTFQR